MDWAHIWHSYKHSPLPGLRNYTLQPVCVLLNPPCFAKPALSRILLGAPVCGLGTHLALVQAFPLTGFKELHPPTRVCFAKPALSRILKKAPVYGLVIHLALVQEFSLGGFKLGVLESPGCFAKPGLSRILQKAPVCGLAIHFAPVQEFTLGGFKLGVLGSPGCVLLNPSLQDLSRKLPHIDWAYICHSHRNS